MKDALLSGVGTLEGRRVHICAMEPRFIGGSMGSVMGEKITRANADQVRQATGFAIGGVPPLGHPERLLTYCDPDLLQYEEVWAAAGTPNSVFAIDPNDLVRMTDAQVTDLTEHT